jgi:cyclopropane fatty-acyl-phospholipid synthase-like methyltransferase
MSTLYARQARFFREAYRTGRHGWPSEGATPYVDALLRRLGSGRGRRALDLGCGEGRHTILLAKRGYETLGVDLEPAALALAKAACRKAGVKARFEVADALELGLSGRFDVVLDYGVFHHVLKRDWGRYRRSVAGALRPGGRLLLSVFSTKFRHHPGERRTRDWLTHRGHYDRFFTLAELRESMAESFDLEAHLEEHEGLNGFHHVLLGVRS